MNWRMFLPNRRKNHEHLFVCKHEKTPPSELPDGFDGGVYKWTCKCGCEDYSRRTKWIRNLLAGPEPERKAVVKQVETSSSLTLTGVVSFSTKDGHLMGSNNAGQVIMVVPLAQVAAAVIDEVVA